MADRKKYGDVGRQWISTRARNRTVQCETTGCSRNAVKNHLLQQKGILSEIATEGIVCELLCNRFNRESFYRFEEKGWENAFTFLGFCSGCDCKLFSRIEGEKNRVPITDHDYCLYGIRPVLHEIRKKQGNVRFEDSTGELCSMKEGKVRWRAYEELAIQSIRPILTLLMEGLERTVPFVHQTRRLPRLDCCASALLLRPWSTGYVSETSGELTPVVGHTLGEIPFNIVTFFPRGNESILIETHHREGPKSSRDFADALKESDEARLCELVSDMLIGQIEDWAISHQLRSVLPSNIGELISLAKINSQLGYGGELGINLYRH